MPTELSILRNRGRHPHRDVNWRWLLAGYISDHRNFGGPELDDHAVVAAQLIQSAYKDHQSEEELAEMLRSGGEYVEAYTFWHTAKSMEFGGIDPLTIPEGKAEFKTVTPKSIEMAALEGMILTGAADDKIITPAGISPDGIRSYEELFFDVRSRLRNSSWIASAVVGTLHQSSPLMMIPALIRAYGYQSKSLDLVRQVAETFETELLSRAAVEEEPNRFFELDRRSTNAMRSAMTARMRPYNRYTYKEILESHNETAELDAKLKQNMGAQSEQDLRDAVNMLRQAMQTGYREAPTNFAEERMLGATPRLLVVNDNNG